MNKQPIRKVRAFNRWYTDVIGLLNRHLLDSEYSLAEARLIYEIHKAGSIRATQIMGLMHIDKSYLSRILKKLEKEKLITRKPAPEDARAALLSLTEKGRNSFVRLNNASDEQIGRLLAPLGEGRRDALVEHMQCITKLLSGPETGEITIRTDLQPGDLGYIVYMQGQVYERENGYGLGFESYLLEGLGEFSRNYDPQKDRLWVCEDGRERVGSLVGVHRGDALQLRYFILLPRYRGLGLGKRLMDLFIGFMREAGYRKAYLWTTNEQEAAISLYTRYGFHLTEEKESNAFGKALIERKYELEL